MVTVNLGDTSANAIRNGQAAVACVRLGWQVLPWRMIDGRKVPQIREWQAGAAFREENDVRAWWGVNFNHSPGIVCGAESGIWVLDVDPRNGGDRAIAGLIQQYGELPTDTFMVATPGGGWHYYFAWDAACEGLRKHAMYGHAGLDVIAEGGWVSAPGAVSDAGPYQVVAGGNQLRTAPGWLLALSMTGNPTQAEDSTDHSGQDGTLDADRWLQEEVVRVAETNPGSQRAALLRFTGALRMRGYTWAVAEDAALRAMHGLLADPDKGMWMEADVIEMLKGAWAKYSPADLGWADTVSTPAVSPPAAMPVETVEVAPEAAPPVPLPVPLAGEQPPPVLPPPVISPPEGEPPESIGPDDENAQDLMLFAKDHLLWVPGIDWMAWDGVRWVPDVGLARFEVIRQLGFWLIQKAGEAGPDGYTVFMRRSQRLGTVQGRDACLNYARPAFATTAEKLDADPWMLNTPGGIVDLRTGALRPAAPSDLVTQVTGVPFIIGARDETWERVLNERIPLAEDQAWLQKWFGYCLTGLDTEKLILAMHGPANTGKSTVTEPFARALGSYAIGWAAETIVANSKVNVAEALFRARGKRLVTVNEMKVGTRLDEGVIKAATGGDKIVARALYQGSIEFRGQFKMWVHTNHVPDTRDDALLARMAFFGMEQALERDARDVGIKTWLEESPSAGSAILWWAWQGLERLQTEKLGRPVGSDDAVEEHALRSDPVRRFLQEVVEPGGPDDVAIWDEIVMAYVAWCATEQLKAMGPSKLQWALAERGLIRQRIRLVDGRRPFAIRGWRMRMDGIGAGMLPT
jgi:P4 family phage/plasmid primase-like protien